MCEFCANELPRRARSDARFCSTRCRVAAHRAAKSLPAEMRSAARWVSWSPDKAPRQLSGRLASSTDSRTWTSWRQIASVARKGFVLNGDGIVCIDLDHCITAGQLSDWAQSVVNACAGTYIEVSQSGTGLHIFGLADVPRGRRIRDGRQIEVYGSGRYIAVTGLRFNGSPSRLADISHAIPA